MQDSLTFKVLGVVELSATGTYAIMAGVLLVGAVMLIRRQG